MKIIITYILILLTGFYLNISAQIPISCTVHNPTKKTLSRNINNYPYAEAPSAKMDFDGNRIVRINIHFTRIYTGKDTVTNFLPVSSNSYQNGYEYIFDVIKSMNYENYCNAPMNLPAGNKTPNLNTRYRILLTGVYFDESENPKKYNDNEAINIFVHPFKSDSDPKKASLNGITYWGDHIDIYGPYDRYCMDFQDKMNGKEIYGLPITGWLTNHEIGHFLSLHHTLLTPYGSLANVEDYCNDTPTLNEVKKNCDESHISVWCPVYGDSCATNNLMDYAGRFVLTPDQINRIHYSLENVTASYLTTSFIKEVSQIEKKGKYNSIIARRSNLDKGSSITINEGENLFINASEVDIRGQLEIKKGGVFIINSSCIQIK